MTCVELEILLCDYVDGTLTTTQKSALEGHLAECPGCAELAREVTGAAGFLERVAVVDPPPELLTRILHEIPTFRQPWWRRMFGTWAERVLQPRYVMGMAMTMVSFSMAARFAGVNPRQLTAADLDPVKIWRSVDDRVHRSWDRGVKYYENMRWVLELQSRLKDFTEQDQEAQKNAAGDSKGQK